VTKAILVAQFLRARAWWRLDSAGASALHVARSVVALLDAAAYLRDVPDDDPDLLALAAAGCFAGGVFDPGPEGADIIRSWQLADEPSAGPRDLLAELTRVAHQASPATAAVSIPRQAGAETQAPARTS
jgi:hypothetical protein